MQEFFTLLIVIAATAYLGSKVYATFQKKDCGSGCFGCDTAKMLQKQKSNP